MPDSPIFARCDALVVWVLQTTRASAAAPRLTEPKIAPLRRVSSGVTAATARCSGTTQRV
jgi:hypothetical protein